jgi:carboxypeptidase Q
MIVIPPGASTMTPASPVRARARQILLLTMIASALSGHTTAQSAARRPAVEREPVDLDAIYRIKDEGFQRSRAMETLSFLSDVHGPRLTNSPGMRAAAEYARKYMTEIGLTNPRFEAWGPFGRGWANERTSVHVVSPQPWVALAYPKAWTPGTKGTLTGEAVAVSIERDEDFAKHKGTLKGRFVLLSPERDVQRLAEPQAARYTDQDLADLARQPVGPTRFARPRSPQTPPAPDATPGSPDARRGATPAQTEFRRRRMTFLMDEGALAIVESSPGDRGDAGAVRVQGPRPGEGSRNPQDPAVLPQIVLAGEHYNRIVRTLKRKVPVTLEVNVQNRFHDQDLMSFNVLADLPGTDKADELVLLGAHFDSWHTGTGATDNAVSCAVVMEAMRILKAAGLQTRRTVRAALWTGEEQGLLGSRAYVKEWLADRETMQLKPGHAKLAAYFNQDNGAGGYRGIYLQGNEAAAPIFEAWMEPFHNLGMTTLAIRPTSGTDHIAFDAVGLPGFQFVQDPLDYDARTHHTNLDLYDRVPPDDVMKNAVILASFAYHAANREERLPRKPLPKPQPVQPGPATPTSGQY